MTERMSDEEFKKYTPDYDYKFNTHHRILFKEAQRAREAEKLLEKELAASIERFHELGVKHGEEIVKLKARLAKWEK